MVDIPNRKDTASLGKTGFFLDTSDSLFENGRDFGRGGFSIGSIASDLVAGSIEWYLNSCSVLSGHFISVMTKQ